MADLRIRDLSAGGAPQGADAFPIERSSSNFSLAYSDITAGKLTNINVSAGTKSNNLSAVTFADSNGISFGLSGSVITGTVKTDYQSSGAYLTTAMQSNAATISNINVSAGATSNNLSALTFSNLNGISFGLSASTITASHNGLTTAMASNRGSDFVQATAAFAGTNANGTIASNGISVSVAAQSNQSAIKGFGASNTGNTAGNTGISSGVDWVIAGTNNVTVSESTTAGGPNTLWLSAGGGGAGVAVYASDGTFSTGTVTLSNNGGALTIGTAASKINFSVPQTSSLVGTNGISVSTNGSTISVIPQWISSLDPYLPNQTMTFNGASISHAVQLYIPQPLSASFIRLPALMTTNSTTIATMASATATASGELYSTLNAVLYSVGVGGNSQSLQSVASGSAGFTWRQSISISNSTQYSITQGFSAQALGVGTTRTTQYSISNTNYSFTTNQIATEWSSGRFIDIPFANSLTPGNYWAVIGMSSSTASAGAAGLAAITNCNVRYSNHYGMSQTNMAFGVMGSTNISSGGMLGAGSFSTAGGGTTNSIPLSAISSSASHNLMAIQLQRNT